MDERATNYETKIYLQWLLFSPPLCSMDISGPSSIEWCKVYTSYRLNILLEDILLEMIGSSAKKTCAQKLGTDLTSELTNS